MPVGPYSQDVLTRIYNVQWGGGAIVVSGDSFSNQKYAKITNKETNFEDLGYLDFTEHGTTNAGAYRNMRGPADTVDRPLFLLGGTDGGGGASGGKGIIMASHDGKKWERVFSALPESAISDATIFAFAWDESEKAFFAGGHVFVFIATPPGVPDITNDFDVLYKSTDGLAWSEVARTMIAQDSEYDTGLITPHFNKKANLPEGMFGYSEERDDSGDVTRSVLIKPLTPATINYKNGLIQITESVHNQVRITTLKDKETTTKVATIGEWGNDARLVCAAYANDIFIAAGVDATPSSSGHSGRISVSFDEGSTWKMASQSTSSVLTVTAAPLNQVESDAGL